MSAEETRNRILNCTVELIKERNGDISNVTIRTIADKAGIGVGLTNHYFKSKELLIEECVNTAFKDLFSSFMTAPSEDPDTLLEHEAAGPMEAAKRAARNVMHFMLNNEALARVAFLQNTASPDISDYTTRLTNSFAYCMVDRHKLEEMLSNDRMTDKMKQQFREHFVSEQRIKAFMITSTLKEAFLRKEYLVATIGVDLDDSEQCDEYVDELVEMLM